MYIRGVQRGDQPKIPPPVIENLAKSPPPPPPVAERSSTKNFRVLENFLENFMFFREIWRIFRNFQRNFH